MRIYGSHSYQDTFNLGVAIGKKIDTPCIIAYFGPMGMGKTAITHGLAHGLGIDEKNVSSPTFALVHEYTGGRMTLYHFDMYRIETWDDLYSTGYFDYIDTDSVLAIEWSENIENALPENYIKIEFKQGNKENDRIIKIDGIDLN